jgi:methionine-rich copper-binding protein CopC
MHSSVAAARSARNKNTLLSAIIGLALSFGFLVAVPPAPAEAATCPCTIFTSTQAPAGPSDSDTAAVELGMKFRADQDGLVTGIRFYKGTGNTGTHTGSLWTAGGNRLATVTFSGETASGWQQANFSSPVAVSADTTYVASYYAPNGRYSADDGYFGDSGVTNAPLTALRDGVDGGNGVYRYGSGGGFPNSTHNSTNYWVDLVFSASGPDTTKPTVTDRQPASGATGVPVSTAISATFSEAVQGSSIVMTLKAGSTTIPASSSYASATRTMTLTPTSNLTPSTNYTVDLSGAKDTAGNQMDPVTWSFTTAASTNACPCTIWPDSTVPSTTSANDSSAVELGVKFRSSQAGYITGIRFYKGSGNTGTHTGSLWSSTGTKLAAVTFSNETATGWQKATFGAPVLITAGTTYVASYYAPVGRYAHNANHFASAATTRGPLTALRNGTDGGNGVYKYGASGFPNSTYQSSNYWVDVVFDATANDTTAPTVVAKMPASDSSGVAVGTGVSATFSEAVTDDSVTMELRSPDNSLVPATTSYNAATQTATLTPRAALADSTKYTSKVSGAKDAAGNAMTPVTWSFTTAAPPPPPPDQGPGGPIALVTSSSNPYSKYFAEILRTEGLNEFKAIDVSTLSSTALAAYDVVVLGNVDVTAGQATMLSDWVNGGGNLIAMKPDSDLSSLLGITSASGTSDDDYLKVDPTTAPGAGIVSTTIQYHGTADHYSLSGAQAIASIYSNASTETSFPAVTLRDVGSSGGQAAAFTFDLALSVVLTRQGNPAWAGDERDGQSPIRSDDMFFGGSATDWINLSKVAIPQADEQQRLLANMIQVMSRDKKPLPRFWYFPRSTKAVVIATGDDHGNGGTAGRFDQYDANSPANCTASEWTCYRSSSYVYPGSPLSDSAAASYTNKGFEVGIHPSTNCANYTPSSIANVYASQLASWKSSLPSVPSPKTNRLHCIAFSDWSSQPKVELANGMRMDTNYYYWPGSWIQNRPGFMTGSGMPMRFADTDGSMLDIYQAMTQMTDESDQAYPFTPNSLIDNALGAPGYYGAFTANMHTDSATIPQNDALIASAKARGVPIVSGKQMLDWIDGRNGSTYGSINWSANTLRFTVGVGTGADGLTGMLPTAGPNGTQLTSITRGDTPVTIIPTTIKGLEYATFPATNGSYSATYGAPAPLTMAAATARTEQTADAQTATVAWETNNVSTSKVLLGTSPDQLSESTGKHDSTRRHSLVVDKLKPKTTYYYRVASTDLSGKEQILPAPSEAPATFTTAATDKVEPKAASPTVTTLPGGTAVLRWTTNEPTTAVVQLGESATKLKERARAIDPIRQHSVVLTGLKPEKTYWLKVESADVAGNDVVSKMITFETPEWGVADQMTASFKRGTVKGSATIDEADLGSITLSGSPTTARKGTFVSGVLDAQAMVDWHKALWDAQVPSGSKLVVSARTGSTLQPDKTWSDWSTVDSEGQITGSSRYIQYKLKMTSPAATAAPILYGIGFSNDGAPPPQEREGS